MRSNIVLGRRPVPLSETYTEDQLVEHIAMLERHRKTLCSVASIEVDWLQRLVTGDEAMKQIGAILSGK